MEGDTITMQDIYLFKQTGIRDGRVMGRLVPTGLRPSFSEKFEVNNIKLPADAFSVEEEQE